ncbi:MAG: ABC transporter permease [Desulfobacterales bacterium]|nr:ABC transporter permease [Desulfobacterales bacterium]
MPPPRSPGIEFWRLLRKNRMAFSGLFVFALFFLMAIIGLAVTSGTKPLVDPSTVRLQEKLRPPFARANTASLNPDEIPPLGIYLLGTDDLGRDVFARMLQGAWVSLTVGFVAVGISVFIGIILGGIAGYYGQQHICIDHLLVCGLLAAAPILAIVGNTLAAALAFLLALPFVGWLWRQAGLPAGKQQPPGFKGLLRGRIVSMDTLIMRAVDIMLCFPTFFLILTVVALLPASLYNIMIVIGLTSWMGTTRFVRAEFLSLREQDFVAAARALGLSDARIIFRHMMPNAIAPVLVSATLGIASAILTEAGLSFLGFGVPPPHATWGNILSDGKAFIFDAPWLTFAPGIVILIVVLAFNLFGEGLRDIFNPKLREQN